MSETTTVIKYPIVSVTANNSENDINIAENVLDRNSGTRWSNLGVGSEITLDLGSINTSVKTVGIQWYYPEGQMGRKNKFDIKASKYGLDFEDVLTNIKSSGKLDMEYYEFNNEVETRYIKIIVNGNDNNDWASILEVEILSAMPEQGTEISEEEFDKFGLRKIYKTATHADAAKPFAIGDLGWKERITMDIGNYSRWNNGDFKGEDSGDDRKIIVKDHSGKDARYSVYAISESSYENTSIETYNRKKLAQKGFMQTKSDWKNVEITGFVYVEKVDDDDDEVTYYVRGGKHSSSKRCEGSALKASIGYKGKIIINKETAHGNDNIKKFDAPDELEDGIIKKWVGFKYCLYNKEVNGKQIPRMEMYVDFLDNDERSVDSTGLPKNDWKLIKSFDDTEDWGDDGRSCDGHTTENIPITWGGPIVTFRWDNVEKVNLKWASVREIVPPT